MEIEFDPAKRDIVLEARGLDLANVPKIFAGPNLTFQDIRMDYGEIRWITIGLLKGRMVVLVWTSRGEKCRVISLRKANDREVKAYSGRLG
jgi:uncharacterized protein